MQQNFSTEEYRDLAARWRIFAQYFETFVTRELMKLGGVVTITTRIKSYEAIREKILRKQTNSGVRTFRLADVRDFFGVRIEVSERSVGEAVKAVLANFGTFVEEFEYPCESTAIDQRRWYSQSLVFKMDRYLADTSETASVRNSIIEVQLVSTFSQAWLTAQHELQYKRVPTSDSLKQDPCAGLRKLLQIVDEFERLVTRDGVKEKSDIHPFLLGCPFLLHPSYEAIVSEVPIGLGTKYRMDFLIHEPNEEYIVVEIENSTHALLTAHGEISAAVNHAVQQVEDWQEWISDNLPMVQREYPGLSNPKGLVVIGLSNSLGDKEKRKIARRNLTMSGRIEIRTYDNLIASRRALLAGMMHQLHC